MEKFNLTFPEENIWLVENFYNLQKINIISGSLIIKKDFDFELAEKAVNKYVELNDGMRIKVTVEDSIPMQYVADFKEFKADRVSAIGKTEEEINKIKDEYISTEFDVIDKPLFSYLLIDRGEGKGEIFLKAHHLICDGWSGSKMVMDLAAIYDKILANDNNFEEYPSYIDYIKKENEYKNSEKYIKDEEYWKEYLKGFTETVSIKNTITETTDAKRYSVRLNRKLNKLILDYCKENRVSPYTVFMTALAIYLERTTEKNDLVIGTPVLNRGNFAEKKMQGMFVSTMPVRFKIDENKTFNDLCQENVKDTMNSFRHQRFPYSKTVENARRENGIQDNLFKIMLSYQNARAKFDKEDSYRMSWNFSRNIQSELEIHIIDLNDDGILEVDYDYNTSLFEDIEIEYLAKRVETIIYDGIVNNKTVETIEIMPEEEKNKILYEFNDTKRDYPKDKTVIELFEEQVRKTPDKVALVFENETMTYDELNKRANSLANYLKSKGIKESDTVAITLDKSIELMVAILAALKVGACYVPVDTNYSIERKKYIVKDAKCKVNICIVDEDYIESVNISKFNYNNYSSENVKRNSSYTWNSLVYIMFTSGTTGKPKGVMINNRNIVRLVKNTNYTDFRENDRIIQTGATVFDASTFEYWGALLNGLTLYLIKKEDLINPETLEKFLIDNKITIMFITTALFNQLVEYNPKIFNSLRVLLTGGEVMSIKHINTAINNSPNTKIANIYGPTENTTFSNFNYLRTEQQKRVPIGIPINNTVNYIVDSKLRLLPLYTEGELVQGGDGVAQGYLNNEELTNIKFVKSPFDKNDRLYRTGDMAQMLEEGLIDFIGRRDNQVKINGFRIELDEIKNIILQINDIKDSFVYVKETGNKKIINAFYTASIDINEDDIKSYLKDKLPRYMVPKYITQIEKIPLNNNGKVDVKELEKHMTINDNAKENFEYDGIYKEIYNLYSSILNIENISPEDNFFDIGGDSLLAVKLVTKAMAKDIIITYADLYKYGSIKQLGDMLSKNNEKKSLSSSIKYIDYTTINKLLNKNKLNNNENIISENYNMKDVILVGATGFLGAHILFEYLQKYDGKIYCLMRGKDIQNESKRLISRLQFFFGKTEIDKYMNRIKVISGDITREEIVNLKIENNITTLINSAACVKHFGKIDYFKKVNELGAKNLAALCYKNNIRLIHISTLSVSGNILETGQVQQVDIEPDTIYNETNLYIGQNLDNVYAYSKYMGEKAVYDYILKGLDAKIMRMGNLTGRSIDGKFQPNVEENAFANRLKTIIELGVLPDNILSFYLEFTPIDYAAKAVIKLSNLNREYNTFHIFNHKHAQMTYVDKVFNEIGINLKHITKKQMTELLDSYMQQDNGYKKIQGLILDINKNKEIEYKPNTIVKSDFTIECLKRLGFEWPEIDKDYIKKYIEYLYSIDFLKQGDE